MPTTDRIANDLTTLLLADALLEWSLVTIGTARYRDRVAQAEYLRDCLAAGTVLEAGVIR